MNAPAHRIVFGVSGASGMPLARAVLAAFASVPSLETHLVISRKAETVLASEAGMCLADLTGLVARVHDADDMAAPPSSGSWPCDGMIVCPCSMSTLASIATGAGQNLVHRAADVTLKERRRLVIVARETPLGRIHLANMLAVTDAGAVVMPFMPAFYCGTMDMDVLIRNFAGRLLDELRIPHDLCLRWEGPGAGRCRPAARRGAACLPD